MYVHLTSAHQGFWYWYRLYKDNTFTHKTVLFGWQNFILWSGLTLLNINRLGNTTVQSIFPIRSTGYHRSHSKDVLV